MICNFINNTSNTRAGVVAYVLINGDACSKRIGTTGVQGTGNGLDIYAGCTLEFNYIKFK